MCSRIIKDKIKKSMGRYHNEDFNNFFSNPYNRKAFEIIVRLIFSNFEPMILSTKLGFKCCSTENHSNQCYNVWEELLDYLCDHYLEDFERKLNSYLIDDFDI